MSADNGSMKFWDYKSGYNFQSNDTLAQPGSMESETGIFCSTFDMTGSRLITGEDDKTIKVNFFSLKGMEILLSSFDRFGKKMTLRHQILIRSWIGSRLYSRPRTLDCNPEHFKKMVWKSLVFWIEINLTFSPILIADKVMTSPSQAGASKSPRFPDLGSPGLTQFFVSCLNSIFGAVDLEQSYIL